MDAPELSWFSQVFALAARREAVRRLGSLACDFGLGLELIAHALGDAADVERLERCTLLVGRDYARLAEVRSDHLSCKTGDFVVVPLRPILATLRDQVFP